MVLLLLLAAAVSFQTPKYVFRPVERGDVVLEWRGTGELEAARQAEVVCRLRAPAGRTTASTLIWLAEEGQRVQKGKVVAKLDDREAVDQVKRAQIGYEQARAGLQTAELERAAKVARIRADLENGRDNVTLAELDVAAAKDETEKKRAEIRLRQAQRNLDVAKQEANARQAQAEAAFGPAKAAIALAEVTLDEAKLDLSHCIIVAPVNGVVSYYQPPGSRFGSGTQSVVAQGESVREGQRLMRIGDSSVLQVRTKVPEALIPRVRVGQPAAIEFAGEKQVGKVQSTSAVADTGDWLSTDVKVYGVVVVFEGPKDSTARPGMTAEVLLRLDAMPNVLRVPLPAVRVHQGQAYCYVKGGSGPEARPVKTGLLGNLHIEIKEGLKEGDEVVQNPPFTPPGAGNVAAPTQGVDLALRSQRLQAEVGRQPLIVRYGLTPDDVAAIRELVPQATAVAPIRLLPGGVTAESTGQSANGLLAGITAEGMLFQPELGSLAVGRGLCPLDEATAANVVVLSSEAAAELFPALDPLNRWVRVSGKAPLFRVVGILQPRRGRATTQEPQAWIPFSSAQRLGVTVLAREQGRRRVEQVQVSELRLRFATVPERDEAVAVITALLEVRRPQRDWQVVALPESKEVQ